MTMGAAKMALESGKQYEDCMKFQISGGLSNSLRVAGKHTGQLKDDVTSPSGTTIRGIQVEY